MEGKLTIYDHKAVLPTTVGLENPGYTKAEIMAAASRNFRHLYDRIPAKRREKIERWVKAELVKLGKS